MNTFADILKTEANLTTTENGAVTLRSTGSSLLDLFSRAGAMRKSDSASIIKIVSNAMDEDPIMALRILFYLRDIRGGQGERRLFRVAIKHIATTHPDLLRKNLKHIPTFGRFDDLLELLDSPLASSVENIVSSQLREDKASDKPSLLAKWLPSENTTSKATRSMAKKVRTFLGMTSKTYRTTLSSLRAKLNLVERELSAKRFDTVNYSAVPSKASLKYRKAFNKRDGVRYQQFLTLVAKGEAKINTATLTPFDLVNKYLHTFGEDRTIETQWANLPNMFEGRSENSLVMADVSGSMSGDPIAVCLSLAIYIAERNKGAFHNLFMTFSESPSIQQIKGNSLRVKLDNLKRADWDMSTNLEAAFLQILKLAKENNVPQEELPTTLYIISDMEFNQCVGNSSMTNFKNAQKAFEQAGYKLPDVVFWNVNARNEQSPVSKDEKGTFLVSGYSPNILKHALNKTTLTPIDFMLEVLNNPRYAIIE